MNPWTQIHLRDYEGHMAHAEVGQAQALCGEIGERLARYPADKVMLLGAAGGNGLEHAAPGKQDRVFCVDINQAYLNACRTRYPALRGIVETIQADLTAPDICLPHAELLIADLVVEYIGCEAFFRVLANVKPQIVSCIIQMNRGRDFVSRSQYARALSALDGFHTTIDG